MNKTIYFALLILFVGVAASYAESGTSLSQGIAIIAVIAASVEIGRKYGIQTKSKKKSN